MILPIIRTIIIFIASLFAGLTYYMGYEKYYLFLIVVLFLVIDHYRGATVFLAFNAYRKEDLDKVKKHIDSIKKPEWLRPSAKAYYNLLQGVLLSAVANHKEAKRYLKKAASGKLSTNHIKFVAHCLVASACLELSQFEEARIYVKQAKQIPHKEEVNEMFEELQANVNKNF